MSPRRAPGLAMCAALAVGLAACQRVGAPGPPGVVAAHPACPAPRVDTADWMLVHDSSDVSYRVPAGFVERAPGELPFRQWTTSADPAGRVSIGFSPSREHWMTLRRAPSPPMREMTECVEPLGDRQILVQAWRTEGGSFRRGRRYDLYEMHALVSVEPTRTLYVTGGGPDPRFQALLLALARTVTVGARP